MADIITFLPRADLNASSNLAGFIDVCRNHLTVFGANLDFDADRWDVSDDVVHRGRNGAVRYVWSNWDTSKKNRTPPLMAQPFLNFAKAYIRYQYGHRPTKTVQNRLNALRALERALSECGNPPDIVNATAHTFNRACSLIGEKLGPSAYRVGQDLEAVAEFVNDNGLVPVKFNWKSFQKRRREVGIRIGKEADQHRLEMLPADGALDALATAFSIATDPRDVLITSVAALLCCAPNRINEVFRLPADCETTGKYEGKAAYGIRWWPSKGEDAYVKWIGPTMVDVARLALENIRNVTDDARCVARWYAHHQNEVYLPDEFEYLRRRKDLHWKEIARLLNFSDKAVSSNIQTWLKGRGAALKNGRVSFADFERAVLSDLPRGFPIYDIETGMEWEEALCVVPQNFFHPNRATNRLMIEKVDEQHVYAGLGNRAEHGVQSVFSRLGLLDEDGQPFVIRSHQFRHWLSTLALQGGLSQLDLAKWAGRDVAQNEHYDHRTAEHFLELARDIGANQIGPLVEAVKKMPVSRAEFSKFMSETIPTAHVTEYGFCVHDFSMLPCQKFADCLNCTEHRCIKGDAEKTSHIRELCELTSVQVVKAEEEVAAGTRGADPWLENHRRALARLEYLLQMFDDPAIPEGTVIQLSIADEASPFRIAADDHKQRGGRDAALLADARALLEDKR